MTKGSTKKIGRPPAAGHDAVAAIALRLFEQRGFDAVTMDDVARAARISRRTLFRMYPAKADLAWAGVQDFVRFGKTLRAQKHASVASIMQNALEPLLTALDEPELATLARRRLRIIAQSPQLLTHSSIARIQRDIAAAFSGMPKNTAALAARSLVSVCFGAILWWAEHPGRMSALEATRTALDALRTR